MNQTDRLKTDGEDAQWFYARHPLVMAFMMFCVFFTVFSLFEWFWPDHPEQSYSLRLRSLVFRAAPMAIVFTALWRWRNPGREPGSQNTEPVR